VGDLDRRQVAGLVAKGGDVLEVTRDLSLKGLHLLDHGLLLARRHVRLVLPPLMRLHALFSLLHILEGFADVVDALLDFGRSRRAVLVRLLLEFLVGCGGPKKDRV